MQVHPRSSENEVSGEIFHQQYKIFQRWWNKERKDYCAS